MVSFGFSLWLPINPEGVRASEMPTRSDLHSACKGSRAGTPGGLFLFCPSTSTHHSGSSFSVAVHNNTLANEDGSTGCILLSYHLWLAESRIEKRVSRSAEHCLCSVWRSERASILLSGLFSIYPHPPCTVHVCIKDIRSHSTNLYQHERGYSKLPQ